MIKFVLFDTETGEITSNKTVLDGDEMAANVPEGRGVLVGSYDPATHYVDRAGPVALLRPVVPVMQGATYDLAQLPSGANLVVIDPVGFSTDVAAQDDTLELTDPGEYRVRSDCPFPYVNFEEVVTVQ